MCVRTFFSMIILSFASSVAAQDINSFSRNDPYFSYLDHEFTELHSMPPSKKALTHENYAKWDPVIYRLTEENINLDGAANRLFAYLYTAQRDFALLSYRVSQQWIGTPDSLIAKIIHLCYPNFNAPQSENDLYSQTLTDLVFNKVQERYRLEESQLKEYSEPLGTNYWKEEPPLVGRRIGSCKPWLLTSLKDFQATPPPGPKSIIWVYGITEIKDAQAHLTSEQRELIKYWAGEFGPESGNWFAIVNRELALKGLPFSDFMLVRAVFAMGVTDAMIAAFDSKYTYWIKRPHMIDPDIKLLIPVPKHPSYPSAHSVVSSSAAVMLSHFFPEEQQKWQKLAIQSGNSRIGAGLHYMFDNEEGFVQGEKVGHAVIRGALLSKTLLK